ncbi:hypothetical protein HMPREF1981_02353 [Bacteroides pyogenes F0041]|uniref:Uncharacterized protein n=1 Tax=Bacteroides pyogenes F0041 TaxID=1321819 RepID=U2DXD9_9BACE|nr:hypothetical protein HMPREF1981_02353 [Bacteroides pyogenes F0041]
MSLPQNSPARCRADEKPFADLTPREADFSSEERTVRLGDLPNTFAYLLNA